MTSRRNLQQSVQQIQQHLSENAAALDAEYALFVPPVAKVQRIGDVSVRHATTSVLPWTSAFGRGAEVAPSIVRGDGPFGGGFGGGIAANNPIKNAGVVTVLGLADLLIVK